MGGKTKKTQLLFYRLVVPYLKFGIISKNTTSLLDHYPSNNLIFNFDNQVHKLLITVKENNLIFFCRVHITQLFL